MESPNYYAIIPADVRYSSELSANEKLLYGEITALCGKTGECWASNGYFAKLYGVDARTIRRWVSKLVSLGFVESAVNDGNIRLMKVKVCKMVVGEGGQNCPRGSEKNVLGGEDKNVRHNNINNNNTSEEEATAHKKKHFWVKGYSDAECWGALRGCRKLDNKVLLDMAEGGAKDIDLNGRLIWRFGEGLDREAAFEVLKERAKEKKEQEGIDKKKKEVV